MISPGRMAILAFAAVLLSPLAAPSQTLRAVRIGIDVNGKPMLTAITGDNGTQPPEVVWRYLTKYPLIPVAGATVEPDADNPLLLTLKGKVTVEVTHGGKTEVDVLHLRRKTEKEGWRVDEKEIEVMATRMGLPNLPAPPPEAPTPSTPKDEMKPGAAPPPTPPPSTPSGFGGSIWVWLLGALVVLVLIAAIYRAMPREHRFDRE